MSSPSHYHTNYSNPNSVVRQAALHGASQNPALPMTTSPSRQYSASYSATKVYSPSRVMTTRYSPNRMTGTYSPGNPNSVVRTAALYTPTTHADYLGGLGAGSMIRAELAKEDEVLHPARPLDEHRPLTRRETHEFSTWLQTGVTSLSKGTVPPPTPSLMLSSAGYSNTFSPARA